MCVKEILFGNCGGYKTGKPMSMFALGIGPDLRKAYPLGHGKDPPQPWEGPSSAINVAKGKGSNSVLVMTFRVISSNRKSTKPTKNKGKAAITAIKYFAPDRAILFSF